MYLEHGCGVDWDTTQRSLNVNLKHDAERTLFDKVVAPGIIPSVIPSGVDRSDGLAVRVLVRGLRTRFKGLPASFPGSAVCVAEARNGISRCCAAQL